MEGEEEEPTGNEQNAEPTQLREEAQIEPEVVQEALPNAGTEALPDAKPPSIADKSDTKLGKSSIPSKAEDKSEIKLGKSSIPSKAEDKSEIKLGKSSIPSKAEDKSDTKLEKISIRSNIKKNSESVKSEAEKSSAKKALSRLMESVGGVGSGPVAFPCTDFLAKRSPYIHDPPQPEERRSRIQNPRTPKEYIINLREDLADYQESHGLPRTRDYSFVTLGLALLQETARAIYSIFLMFKELFPIVAIFSLLLRFTLDKLIEILETEEAVPKLKKSIIFALELLLIVIPLWILLTSIILPLLALVLSLLKSVFRFHTGRKCGAKQKKKAALCLALLH